MPGQEVLGLVRSKNFTVFYPPLLLLGLEMSTRPVPRRESPWGVSEGDHRQPQAHRCNDRVEDVIQACFEGNPFKTVPGPFKLFWQCMRSKPGFA
ncbi:Hexokinase-1 [Cinnamomum micranthum f. kanehirae]|uniref:Hexokinase-1 n=1 Tax=Cinnamomum micranthum f. kanehirae TaxID=337451 RepID=A0A3S4PAQ2_9MAGN|nr:Hexokinase-1 [Cinnamomum micranthum f. kanehirae]